MESSSGIDDDPPPEPRDGWLLVRIHVPELNVYKCLQFPAERLVWDVKQQVLASLPKELKESFNYGLFCPPSNGKAGKFLDEERRLGDYPFNGPVGYLELKYKRRVYKMLNLDERQLKALHTRANLRRFMECINGGHVEKIAKMCAKGLDPNFHCPESGETPLTIATGTKKPNKILIALVNGGALLDYRTKDGATALHRAVEKDSIEAVTTLLELGASPNYKDAKGITPLYLSVTKKTDPKITESLLHDHATLGTQDNQGWQEVHQACRHGLVHHLEHLLFYGADMDSRNASGNTPLHVCAVNNQEACARMLLFRGAQRGALNYANQTPYQVAVIAGNLDLAEVIQNYKSDDIVPFRGPPRYNPRRRSAIGWMGCGGSLGINSGNTLLNSVRNSQYGPPSPCPSEHPYSSASSSLSEGSSGHRSHEDDISIVTDKSLGDTSDIISDSSGVGTNSDSAACSIGHPSTTVVCMEPYPGNASGHIRLQAGEVIEVVGSTDCGLLEGYVRGTNRSGFFPVEYVQEVNIRQKSITNVSTANQYQSSPPLSTNAQQQQSNLNIINNNNLNFAIPPSLNGQFSTAPRIKKSNLMEPRTVILHRAKRGFGFVLRGAKASSPLMQLKPSERFPALQYLDDVDPGGVADRSGLRPGDFLLAINNHDVRDASHEQVVDMIRASGALVSMTVISPNFPNQMPQHQQQQLMQHHGSGSIGNTTNGGGSGMSTPVQARQCATLPRKMSLGPGGKLPAPMPPRRDPKTTLSVGRARAKSMVAGLENGGEKNDEEDAPAKSSSIESISTSTPTQNPGTPVQLRTASIKARPTSSRITAAELEELFQRQQGEAADGSSRYSTMMTSSRFQSGTDSGAATPPNGSLSPQKGPLVYASVAEMKRNKKIKNGGTLRGKPCAIPTIGADLKRNFHSTPDLNTQLNSSSSSIWNAAQVGKTHHSQDDVAALLLNASIQRLNLPPPNHPPPPPPVGQVVKVEVSRGEYESTTAIQKKIQEAKNNGTTVISQDGVVSSFNPSTNAKLYASPQDLKNMAFRQRQENNRKNSNPRIPSLQNLQQNNQQPIQQQQQQQQHQHQQLHQQQQQQSQYAQPGIQIGNQQPQQQQKIYASQNTSSQQQVPGGPAPPIPDPDYSLSESDDDENSILVARNTKLNEKIALIDVPETSGNSHTSGSSSGSSSIPHSFSVDEIQKMRTKLKTSKSFPNNLKNDADEQNGNLNNANHNNNNQQDDNGDNSSSGVSSDQEIPTNNMDTIKKKPSSNNSTTTNIGVIAHAVSQQQQQHVQQQQMKQQQPTITQQAPQQMHNQPTNIQKQNIHMQNIPYQQQSQNVQHHQAQQQQQPILINHHQQIQNTQQPQKVQHHVKQVQIMQQPISAVSTQQSARIATQPILKPVVIKSTAVASCQQQPSKILKSTGMKPLKIDVEQRSDDDGELSPSPPANAFKRHNSLTRKQAAQIAMTRSTRTTPAVSLVQLPPPIESADLDEVDVAYIGGQPICTDPTCPDNNIVLAPPPQFCDCNDLKHSASALKQTSTNSRVRIVGAVPKSSNSRLNSH